MAKSRLFPLVLAGVLASMGASYRSQTTNFIVDAPTPQIAQQVAQYAEHYRKEKAEQWIGRELPPWREPLPLRVTLAQHGGGATTFEYGNGEVMGQHMQVFGPLDRVLASVLPHEITHTIFAHYFRCPVPRWADEGGAVLSEDDIERNRHDQMVRQILNSPGRAMALRRLMTLRDYPGDVMALYAQGFSVTNFLVNAAGRPTFLNFVAHAMRHGWDSAVQTHYRYRSIEDLERAWIESLRAPRQGPVLLAQNTDPRGADPARRVVVRQTAPAMQAALDNPRPIYRGQASTEADSDGWGPRGASTGSGQPIPLSVSPTRPPAPPWPGKGPDQPASVILGPPQMAPASPPQTHLGPPIPAYPSLAGYPRE
jgi:hypothetical protein